MAEVELPLPSVRGSMPTKGGQLPFEQARSETTPESRGRLPGQEGGTKKREEKHPKQRTKLERALREHTLKEMLTDV